MAGGTTRFSRVLSEIVHSIEWRARGVQQYVHDNDTQDHWTKRGWGGGVPFGRGWI